MFFIQFFSSRRTLFLLVTLSIILFGGNWRNGLAQDGHRDERLLPRHASGETIVEYGGYTLSYSEEHEQALWVAYELTKAETEGKFKRTDNFRDDPRIPTGSATPDDYRRSGYDRGHLAPAADMDWSKNAVSESFFMSNMSPQLPGFNRGIWKSLEEQIRLWAREHEALYVVTGPVLTMKPLATVGKNKVSVPGAYYKVLADVREPGIGGIGFLMPHEESGEPLYSFAAPIDRIEEITGLDFFPALDDPLETAIESRVDLARWGWPDQGVIASSETPSLESPSPQPAPEAQSPINWRWILIAMVVIIVIMIVIRFL